MLRSDPDLLNKITDILFGIFITYAQEDIHTSLYTHMHILTRLNAYVRRYLHIYLCATHQHSLVASGLAAFEPRLRSVVSVCSVRARLLALRRRFPSRVNAVRGAAAPLPFDPLCSSIPSLTISTSTIQTAGLFFCPNQNIQLFLSFIL